jgi:capsular polysaccharide biosynthesis protein
MRRQGNRSILNHDAMLRAIRQAWRGEVTEHTGKEPVSTQLQMFADADTVIGPHGSGFANIIVMPQGRRVVEFLFVHGQEKPNYCFVMLSLTLGLRYYSFYEAAARWDGQWAVDIDKVLSLPVFK